jgi:hypothetical protein
MTITEHPSVDDRGDTQRKQVPGGDPSQDERHNRSYSHPTAHDGFRAVDNYVAKGIDAWALLETNSKGPGRNLRIRMKYPPDEVASESPEFERALWRAKAIERQSRLVIGGKPNEVLTEMIFSVIVYLLGVLDSCHSMSDDSARNDNGTRGMTRAERVDRGTEIAEAELARLSRFASDAELRSALKRYVQGLPIGITAVILLGWLASLTPMFQRSIADIDLVRALSAGAIGATVSVMIRITRGQKFDVDSTQGLAMTMLAGAFRPVVGAVLGASLYVLLLAGLLPLEIPQESAGYFFAAVGFLGGFSERWAQDTIVRSVPMQATATNSRLNRLGGDTETKDDIESTTSRRRNRHSGSGAKEARSLTAKSETQTANEQGPISLAKT